MCFCPRKDKDGGVKMRESRIKEAGKACYHVMSRIIDKRMILNEDEKTRLRDLMRRMEAFSGLQILTYTIMGNHFHIVLHVPEREDVTDEEFVRRLAFLYDKQTVDRHAASLRRFREGDQNEAANEYRKRFTYRMYDLSEYMKTVKQRFTQSYNRRHDRKGTLWEERFKSLVVQPPTTQRSSVRSTMTAIAAVALYVDLNALRAGMVVDPKDYCYCGYAEAVAGSQLARKGLEFVLGCSESDDNWVQVATLYREMISVRGSRRETARNDHAAAEKPFSEKTRIRREAGGRQGMAELLRGRVRYFSDGVVLGTRRYVDDILSRHRGFFGHTRPSIARKLEGVAWGDLFAGRDLRGDIIIPSPVGS